MIRSLAARAIKRASADYYAPVFIPPGGIQITSAPIELLAIFNRSFHLVERVAAELTFEGDLWDTGESWYIPEFGGQENGGETSQASARLEIEDAGMLMQFAGGRFRFHLQAISGSMLLTEMRFVITGVAHAGAIVPHFRTHVVCGLSANFPDKYARKYKFELLEGDPLTASGENMTVVPGHEDTCPMGGLESWNLNATVMRDSQLTRFRFTVTQDLIVVADHLFEVSELALPHGPLP